MFYVQIKDGKAVAAEVCSAETSEKIGNAWRRNGQGDGWEYRGDWKTFERAEQVAKELNEAAVQTVARPYIATDSGPHVSPRFDVIKRPHVGEAVSYTFNGDYYPDGYITKVSGKEFRIITTDTGSVYYRRKQTGGWIKKGGTWALTPGHRTEWNPSF